MQKRLVVIGGGESGVGAAVLAKHKGYDVFLSDKGGLKAKYKEVLAKEKIDCEVINIGSVKPLDEEMLHEVFSKYNKVITIEDGTVMGGFGSAVLEFMNEHGYKADVKIMGIPDRLVEHGTPKQLYDEIGIDANGIVKVLREMSAVTVTELVR